MSEPDSGENVNLPVSVATRLSQDTADRLDEYCERESMGRSVGARTLLRDGLNRELGENTDDDKDTNIGGALLLLGLLLSLAVAAGHFSGGGQPDTVLYVLAAALVSAGAILKYTPPSMW